MSAPRFDQINVVVSDAAAAAEFLQALGVDVPDTTGDWRAWQPHHREISAVADGFSADLDSSAFAHYWGGLPDGFTGVVVNLRTVDRGEVDDLFSKAIGLGASGLRAPYDAFWGARYALVQAPGPLAVGFISTPDPAHRLPPPSVADFT